jgi:hypothetical protein
VLPPLDPEAASILHTGTAWVIRPYEDGPSLGDIAAPVILAGDPATCPSDLCDRVDLCVTARSDPPRPWVNADLDRVVAAVAAQPLASLALVSLLRSLDRLAVPAAIAAESASYCMLLGSAPYLHWLAARGPAREVERAASPVRLARVDDVLRIVLAVPSRRNAFDTAMRDALVDALRVAALDATITGVVLEGEGECFSSGGDLDEFGTVSDPATAHAVRLTRHPGRAVHAVADRTTAHLSGPCVGAGIEVPAFAHHVTATTTTTFRLPEVSMGLIPGAGGTVSISRRIGRHRTAWMALTGDLLPAQTALTWGLVDKIR